MDLPATATNGGRRWLKSDPMAMTVGMGSERRLRFLRGRAVFDSRKTQQLLRKPSITINKIENFI